MSIDTCTHCNAYIDTDEDGDCYIEIGNMRRLTDTICLCEPCREKYFEEQDELHAAGDYAADQAAKREP